MHTTAQWWERVSTNPEEMIDWLYDQYRGERNAAEKISKLVETYELTGRRKQVIEIIAAQEAKHADWIAELLESRGLPVEVQEREERYWDKTLKKDMTFSYLCAVGHHAEVMRLDRINLLAADDRFRDIAEVFSRIRREEVFHASAFKRMSTPEDIEAARSSHEEGMQALGLVA